MRRRAGGRWRSPSHDWVFFLDADERVPEALRDEIRGALDDAGRSGSRGSRCRASRLFSGGPFATARGIPTSSSGSGGARRDSASPAGGCTSRSRPMASSGVSATPLRHDPYRDLSDALRKASLYARLAAADRAGARRARGRRGDRGPARFRVRPELHRQARLPRRRDRRRGCLPARVVLLSARGVPLRGGAARGRNRSGGRMKRRRGVSTSRMRWRWPPRSALPGACGRSGKPAAPRAGRSCRGPGGDRPPDRPGASAAKRRRARRRSATSSGSRQERQPARSSAASGCPARRRRPGPGSGSVRATEPSLRRTNAPCRDRARRSFAAAPARASSHGGRSPRRVRPGGSGARATGRVRCRASATPRPGS